ncbi:coiled-coil domain-containing protein 174 [Hylaeus anthracinus]|uniref:coiled-coil domain-containing protein 174 n=1 Tax=Hylaeus anthracinus TaxID=313031 RepID=UPI0023B8D7DE|nr:coiled-coil domain-containing protein 174 [Hylaeus anthracinus]
MNTSKKINVNFSSLVGLKAELLRKQTEVNQAKLRSEVNNPVPKVKKKPKKSKENATKESSDKSEYIEDVNTLKKSKLMLEAKARLYERMKKSKNNNENFLVDFTNKSDESEAESLPKDEEDINDETFGNEDDWVEYEDCFGRTRKCLIEDLPLMQEKDKLIKQQIISKKGIDLKANAEQNFVQEEKEPEIEIMRRKWEEQTAKLADKVNIHYQDVLFDEARAHGVGYFAFSQDEEQRAKQQENLSKLRKETEQKQKEIKELKELRAKMEQNRLKAARIRQRVRAGLPIEPEEEEEEVGEELKEKVNNESNVSTEIKEEDESTESQPKEEDKAVERENKIKALGELLGKRNRWYEMSQEEWVDKCRKIRATEFGPMYDNFKSAGYIGSRYYPNSESSGTSLNDQSKEKLNETNVQDEIEDDTETNIDSYDIPLPPTLTGNHFNNEENNSRINSPQIIDTIAANNTQNQTIQARSIDEANIAAGLRYLREKFEESQNS